MRSLFKKIISRRVFFGTCSWVRLPVFLLTTTVCSSAIAAPPPLSQCEKSWEINSAAKAGLKFGSFSLDTGGGTITLTGGSARASSGVVDLVSSIVSSYTVTINNTLSSECGFYGITIDWDRGISPDNMPIKGSVSEIPVSNTLVTLSDDGLVSLPYAYSPPTVPVTVEVTATMSPVFGQLAETYTSKGYKLVVNQDNRTFRSSRAVSTTTAITPLTIAKGINMDFGEVSSGAAGGTIILNATSGARSVSADADVIGDGTAGTPGTFNVQGVANQTFSVSYSNGTLTDTTGANPITISGFTDTSASITLTGGVDTLSVGATLTLNSLQPADDYSTQNPGGVAYGITINYN